MNIPQWIKLATSVVVFFITLFAGWMQFEAHLDDKILEQTTVFTTMYIDDLRMRNMILEMKIKQAAKNGIDVTTLELEKMMVESSIAKLVKGGS